MGLPLGLAGRGERTSTPRPPARSELGVGRSYLENLAASDPEAIHVIVRDQGGFHLRDGDERLPERVRIVDLPPYSPVLD